MTTKDSTKHVLAGNSNVTEQFPCDVYVPACVIAYQIADLPPSQFAQNNDVVPSVRFLFSDGSIRKWTDWLRISYHLKAKLPKMFVGFNNLPKMLQDDDDGGALWTTPCKILLESSNEKYSKIIRIKPDVSPDAETPSAVYDVEFVPYKYVKAFGNLVNLRLAVLKTGEGVKRLSPDDMIDPPEQTEG